MVSEMRSKCSFSESFLKPAVSLSDTAPQEIGIDWRDRVFIWEKGGGRGWLPLL